jgi:hypothetical protein
MSSLLKTSEALAKAETNTDYLLSFEKHLLTLSDPQEVELIMKKLKYLGLNYDPFSSKVPSECITIVEQLGLEAHLVNPYLATNILLRLLDLTEEKLNLLKQ